MGAPDPCIEIARRQETSGGDLLFCLSNPHKIEHIAVMEYIGVVDEQMLPAFAD